MTLWQTSPFPKTIGALERLEAANLIAPGWRAASADEFLAGLLDRLREALLAD